MSEPVYHVFALNGGKYQQETKEPLPWSEAVKLHVSFPTILKPRTEIVR